ncbi:MAG: hypothetical protein R3E84_19510 [Pseudomonadales bacterium]
MAFTVNDGTVDSNTQTRDITVASVNDDPINIGSLPTDVAVTEDVLSNVDLSAIDLSDVDHNGGNLTVTLTTSTGGNLSASSGGGAYRRWFRFASHAHRHTGESQHVSGHRQQHPVPARHRQPQWQ